MSTDLRPQTIEKIAAELLDCDAVNLDCQGKGFGNNCREAVAALRALMIENAELRQQKDAAEDQAKAYLDAVTDAWANNEQIRARLMELRGELNSIEEMFDEGQGDDDGPQVLPDLTDDMSTPAKVEACLHLLERRRDVITSWT